MLEHAKPQQIKNFAKPALASSATREDAQLRVSTSQQDQVLKLDFTKKIRKMKQSIKVPAMLSSKNANADE